MSRLSWSASCRICMRSLIIDRLVFWIVASVRFSYGFFGVSDFGHEVVHASLVGLYAQLRASELLAFDYERTI